MATPNAIRPREGLEKEGLEPHLLIVNGQVTELFEQVLKVFRRVTNCFERCPNYLNADTGL